MIQHYKQVLKCLSDARLRGQKDLSDGPFTIVSEQRLLPNVDPHDYVSLAPYFWPNPDTPDGLPFVRHDGVRNPQIYKYDVVPLDAIRAMCIDWPWRDTSRAIGASATGPRS